MKAITQETFSYLLASNFIRCVYAISFFLFFNTYGFSQNWLWAKSASGTFENTGFYVCTDINGNVYVTGQYGSRTISFGYVTLSNTILKK